MITACGWRQSDLAETEWWLVEDLCDYWADNPPLHEIAAAYVGLKPKTKSQPVAVDGNDPSGIGALIAQFPNGFVPANR